MTWFLITQSMTNNQAQKGLIWSSANKCGAFIDFMEGPDSLSSNFPSLGHVLFWLGLGGSESGLIRDSSSAEAHMGTSGRSTQPDFFILKDIIQILDGALGA